MGSAGSLCTDGDPSDGFSELSFLPRIPTHSYVEAREGQTLAYEQALTRVRSQHHGSQSPCIQKHSFLAVSVHRHTVSSGLVAYLEPALLFLCPSRVVKESAEYLGSFPESASSELHVIRPVLGVEDAPRCIWGVGESVHALQGLEEDDGVLFHHTRSHSFEIGSL